MDKELLNEIVTDFPKVSDEVSMSERKLAALMRKDNGIQQKAEEIKREVYLEVSNETDAEGKKKFTNEATRDAETQKRLRVHAEHRVLMQEEDTLMEEIHSLKQDIQLLYRKMDYYKLVVKIAEVLTRTL